MYLLILLTMQTLVSNRYKKRENCNKLLKNSVVLSSSTYSSSTLVKAVSHLWIKRLNFSSENPKNKLQIKILSKKVKNQYHRKKDRTNLS